MKTYLKIVVTFILLCCFAGCADNGVAPCDCKREIRYSTVYGFTMDEATPEYLKTGNGIYSIAPDALEDTLLSVDRRSQDTLRIIRNYTGGALPDFPYGSNGFTLEEAVEDCAKHLGLTDYSIIIPQVSKHIKKNRDFYFVGYVLMNPVNVMGYNAMYCFIRRTDKLVLND